MFENKMFDRSKMFAWYENALSAEEYERMENLVCVHCKQTFGDHFGLNCPPQEYTELKEGA